ncbi:hypothetical protein BKA70DRAFT_1432644 [Coprinopsis sp. MPI-PUGE-AT-0042]|nr:hypothetical protein BKA70DRAFT_1432644 [Coprinopsis sp. MPI-PUGE-AT-0042]
MAAPPNTSLNLEETKNADGNWAEKAFSRIMDAVRSRTRGDKEANTSLDHDVPVQELEALAKDSILPELQRGLDPESAQIFERARQRYREEIKNARFTDIAIDSRPQELTIILPHDYPSAVDEVPEGFLVENPWEDHHIALKISDLKSSLTEIVLRKWVLRIRFLIRLGLWYVQQGRLIDANKMIAVESALHEPSGLMSVLISITCHLCSTADRDRQRLHVDPRCPLDGTCDIHLVLREAGGIMGEDADLSHIRFNVKTQDECPPSPTLSLASSFLSIDLGPIQQARDTLKAAALAGEEDQYLTRRPLDTPPEIFQKLIASQLEDLIQLEIALVDDTVPGTPVAQGFRLANAPSPDNSFHEPQSRNDSGWPLYATVIDFAADVPECNKERVSGISEACTICDIA